MRQSIPLVMLGVITVSFSCTTKGPDVIDPEADKRTETAIIALNKSGAGELARYYEVTGTVTQSEYETANGQALSVPINAIYEEDEQLWLHSNPTGKIIVLDLSTRRQLAEIDGFPAGDTASLCGMAFSNVSQGWAIAYGARSIFHVDARNHVMVGSIPLPGNPTSVATNDLLNRSQEDDFRDNRVYVSLEKDNGTGSLATFHSNDPDRVIRELVTFPRPPIFIGINPDNQFMAVIVPGQPEDDPGTFEIETDPTLFVVDLLIDQIIFGQPFISPPLLEHLGVHPNFASMTRDSFLYLATREGVIRVDTKAWGEFNNILPGKAYNVVGADEWTDLLYAVASDAPNTIERVPRRGSLLSSVTLDHPVEYIRFVSSNEIAQ